MSIEYLTMAEAREYLGVSRTKMWQFVKDGSLSTYTDPRDKRKRLLIKSDLDKLRQPKLRSG